MTTGHHTLQPVKGTAKLHKNLNSIRKKHLENS